MHILAIPLVTGLSVPAPHPSLALVLGTHQGSLVPTVFSTPQGLSQSLPRYLRLPAEAKEKYKQSQLWVRLTGSRTPISLVQPESPDPSQMALCLPLLPPLTSPCTTLAKVSHPFCTLQRLLPTRKQRFLGPLEQHVTGLRHCAQCPLQTYKCASLALFLPIG